MGETIGMNRGTSRRLTSAAFALAAVSCAAPAVASAATPIAPAADAYVDQAHAAASYGTKTSLLTSGAQSAYLRFDTGALAGAVQSAHLRLYAASAAASAPALSLVSNDWTEGVTWNTRPSVLGGTFAAPGAVAAGSWVDYDVTSAITQSGSYSFQLSGSAASFKSREVASDAKRPQLVIATSAAADSTPPAVDIVSPTDDAEVSGQLDVTASASDASGVLSVDLSVDGVSQGSDAASPYSYAVDTSALSDGQHTLTATAVDTAGNTSEKSETVVVGNAAATQAPCSWYASPNGSPTASGRSSVGPAGDHPGHREARRRRGRLHPGRDVQPVADAVPAEVGHGRPRRGLPLRGRHGHPAPGERRLDPRDAEDRQRHPLRHRRRLHHRRREHRLERLPV